MNKKLLAVAVGSAIAAPMTAQAVDFKVSGHINRMIRFADNGAGSDIQQTDNTASRSRVRWTGSQEIGNGVTAGVRLEIGLASNQSGGIAPKSGDGSDDSFGGAIRHSALFFSGNFGKVTMGHTSTASDGMTFADNSGTFLGAEFSSAEHCSACVWTLDTAGDPATAFTLGGTTNTFDGGRRDILRYDSPSLGGVAVVKASVGNNEYWDIGATVNTALAGGQLGINAGYHHDGNAREGGLTKRDRTGVSASYLFSQGTSITAAYGTEDIRGPRDFGDDWAAYIKVGHKWGNNAASIDYGHYVTADQNGAGNDLEHDSIGLAFVHTLPKVGVEAYAGYHYHWADLDASAVDINDIHVAVVGARVKFQ